MEAWRRKELGDFLRKSRGRRTPADVGLPPGARRRTPGLRRQEVADLAGVGPTWYTWLEQGRDINVSPRTLHAIADALGLNRLERDHVLHLAGVASRHTRSAVAPARVPDVVRALLRQIDPFPACVYSLGYDLLLCNDGYAACFPELAAADGEDRNILRYFSRADDEIFAAHERVIGAMVGRFRANYGTNTEDPRWRSLVDDVILRNPRMREHWERHVVNDAAESHDAVTTAVGDIAFTSAPLATGTNLELNILVSVPRTEGDRRLLDELLNLET